MQTTCRIPMWSFQVGPNPIFVLSLPSCLFLMHFVKGKLTEQAELKCKIVFNLVEIIRSALKQASLLYDLVEKPAFNFTNLSQMESQRSIRPVLIKQIIAHTFSEIDKDLVVRSQIKFLCFQGLAFQRERCFDHVPESVFITSIAKLSRRGITNHALLEPVTMSQFEASYQLPYQGLLQY